MKAGDEIQVTHPDGGVEILVVTRTTKTIIMTVKGRFNRFGLAYFYDPSYKVSTEWIKRINP